MNKPKIGVILANLGTPDSPNPRAISRYLWQFLTDPRVVDLPRYKWYPLLKALILPLRAKRIAKDYRRIWTEQGSPLLNITQKQQAALQTYFKGQAQEIIVEIGMTYGNPSMESAAEKLMRQQVDRMIILPLFPQYSSTTTGALFDAFAKALRKQRKIVPFEFIHSYHLHQDYIKALACACKARLKSHEFLLFSFHGIPLRYENLGDFYRTHCQQTAFAVVKILGLSEHQWGVTFQSRFGKEEWLQPYTNDFLSRAASGGIKNIAVICPGFSADCLETLEEIAKESRTIFMQGGGESYQYIPALNAEPDHIHLLAKLILNAIEKIDYQNTDIPDELPPELPLPEAHLANKCR